MGSNRDSIPRRAFLNHAFVAAAAAAFQGFFRPGTVLSGTAGPPGATESLEDLYRGLQLYWGDLHAHTGYSDGFDTPPASFEYGRSQQGLDFCAITDHAEWIGFFQNRLQMADGSPLPLWTNLIAEVEARYAPGAFVTFPGYEWTSDEHGHRTVVFGRTDPLPELPPSTISHPTPEELWAALAPYTAMTIPHHVTRWGRLMNWSHYNPALDRLVEIYSKWGNGASAWTSYEPPTHYMQYPFLRGQAAPSGVDAMLALGHRIGIIASTDSHQGHPGSTAPDEPLGTILSPADYPTTGEDFLEALEQGYTVDHREPAGGGGGLAAVWATELTREAVWEGLYGRRTFATSGARPIVKFGVCDGAIPGAGAAMGGEISVVGAPSLLASAVPEQGSSVTHIVLLKTNEPLLTVTNPAPGVAVSFQDDALAVGETACYRAVVFITQEQSANRDRDTILKYDRGSGFFQSSEPRLDEQVWTSPVWVTRAGP